MKILAANLLYKMKYSFVKRHHRARDIKNYDNRQKVKQIKENFFLLKNILEL